MDTAAVNAEVAEIVAGLNVSWSDIKTLMRGLIVAATLNGGTTSYTINGRSKTVSLDFLKSVLLLAEQRAPGALVVQLGEFG